MVISSEFRNCLNHFGNNVRIVWDYHEDYGRVGAIVGCSTLAGFLPSYPFEYITVRFADDNKTAIFRPKHVTFI